MKIELEVPEWAEPCNLYFMAGIELMGYKVASENTFYVKEGRCSRCGKCCMAGNVPRVFPKADNGDCMHLKKDGDKYTCGLGAMRPYPCSSSRGGSVDGCTITYREVKL